MKSFFGMRKTFTFELDINTTIQQIKNSIIENSQENAKSLYNLRLIYPMVFISFIYIYIYIFMSKMSIFIGLLNTILFFTNKKGSDK